MLPKGCWLHRLTSTADPTLMWSAPWLVRWTWSDVRVVSGLLILVSCHWNKLPCTRCRSSTSRSMFTLSAHGTGELLTQKGGGSTPNLDQVCVEPYKAKRASSLHPPSRSTASLCGWPQKYCAIKVS